MRAIAAPPAEGCKRFLANVGDWWNSARTFSHNAHNLSFEDRVGGCLCGKYPGGGVSGEGGVRHLQIIHLNPGKAILLSGGMGPLSSMAVTGSMDPQFTPSGTGTKLVVTCAAGGYVPAGLNTWAAPVDGILTEQFTRFKNYVEHGKPELSSVMPPRPKILAIGHIALSVHDIEKSRQYDYKDFLGYQEPFKLDNPDGSLSLTFIKINDRQYIELFPEKAANTDRLNHISIEVDDAEAMRVYLKANGIPVPDKVAKGRIGNSNFNIKDPDGHTVEIVQYEPDGFSLREKGRFMEGPRFLSWVNLKVPDGTDYLEFMLYDREPTLTQLGNMHHLCLEVEDIDKALSELNARSSKAAWTEQPEIRTGVNRRRQINLFDPDGTRSELMEPRSIDGQPAPSSAAAPPGRPVKSAGLVFTRRLLPPLRPHLRPKRFLRFIHKFQITLRIDKRIHPAALHPLPLLQHPVIVPVRPQKHIALQPAQHPETLLEIRRNPRPRRRLLHQPHPWINRRPAHKHHLQRLAVLHHRHRVSRASQAVSRRQMRHQRHTPQRHLLTIPHNMIHLHRRIRLLFPPPRILRPAALQHRRVFRARINLRVRQILQISLPRHVVVMRLPVQQDLHVFWAKPQLPHVVPDNRHRLRITAVEDDVPLRRRNQVRSNVVGAHIIDIADHFVTRVRAVPRNRGHQKERYQYTDHACHYDNLKPPDLNNLLPANSEWQLIREHPGPAS
jgi:catechol 2,3-dioxygenase-like lactoylglutathione lyase family enzyme